MNRTHQTRIALVLIALPMALGFLIQTLGGPPAITMYYAPEWEGPFFIPGKVTFEIYGLGLVFVPILCSGLLWLAALATQFVLSDVDPNRQNA